MSTWKKEQFETCVFPDNGDKVQFVAIHILRFEKMKKLLGAKDEPEFYIREIAADNQDRMS